MKNGEKMRWRAKPFICFWLSYVVFVSVKNAIRLSIHSMIIDLPRNTTLSPNGSDSVVTLDNFIVTKHVRYDWGHHCVSI